MGYRSLRVINDDRVAARGGFPTHPHRDMEILSYVVEGALEHRDSMGNGSVIRPGDVQRMTAGTGVSHSEFNPSDSDPMRLLQIWILPEQTGLEPSYEQRHFAESDRRGRLRLIASRDGREASVRLRQDADVYASVVGPGDALDHEVADGRGSWIQVVRGRLEVNGETLHEGDGASLEGPATARISGEGELLLFDLA
jgi:redox-sensitive bicupin YhaK (pirin superfamily)